MAFNFRVVFTGICTFVPHMDGTKLCVLLPDGTRAHENPGHTAHDGTPFEFHQGFLEFDPRDLDTGFSLSRARMVWDIDRPGGRIEFGVTHPAGVKPSTQGLTTKPANVIDLAEFSDVPTLVHVADWALQASAAHQPEDPTPFPPNTVAPRVLSQVLFKEGRVSGEELSDVEWSFHNHLGKEKDPTRLDHEVVVTIEDVDKVEVCYTEFNSSSPRLLFTFVRSINLDTLRISNFCKDNPLRWRGAQHQLRDDEDFRWHYEVLGDAAGVIQKLAGKDLPHPKDPKPIAPSVPVRPVASLRKSTNANGNNCYPTFTPMRAFSI